MTAKLTERQMLLHGLIADGTIRMCWAPEVLGQPAPFAGRRVSADRIRGMLLGLAIGDSLGNTSESQLPDIRQAQLGEVRDYLPNRYADYRRVGLPSDDTQLAFWLLQHLLQYGCVEPNALAELFCSHRIFGIGIATEKFVLAWRETRDWRKATQSSAGNGALMRIAPTLIPHLDRGGADMWVDAVLGTAVTHNDPSAIASSVAFVGMLAELLTMEAAPAADWWVKSFVKRARPIEGDDTRYEPRGGSFAGKWSGPLWQFVEQHVPSNIAVPTVEAAATWYSGAFLLETVPTVLHVLARHAADPEKAIVRAVNDTKDNDTIAAIVGAAVGALHGEEALPKRWRDGLSGRAIADVDDKRLLEVLDAAIQRFVPRRNAHADMAVERPDDLHNGAPARAELEQLIEQLQAEKAGLQDKYLRAVADTQNARRRAEQEVEKERKFGIERFARDVLSVADNLGRALSALPADLPAADPALGNVIAGVQATDRDLQSILERHGVNRIDTLGKPFNAEFHQAMMEVEDASVPSGTVVQELIPGYLLAGRLLRAAMVAVSRGGPTRNASNES